MRGMKVRVFFVLALTLWKGNSLLMPYRIHQIQPSHHDVLRGCKSPCNTCVAMSKDLNDEESSESESVDISNQSELQSEDSTSLEKAQSTMANEQEDPKELPNLVKKAVWGVFLVWSYSLWFLGGVFSIGLLLNLCGYGYVFSKESGVRIDTITQLRQERQMQEESIRYRKDYEKRLLDQSQKSIPKVAGSDAEN